MILLHVYCVHCNETNIHQEEMAIKRRQSDYKIPQLSPILARNYCHPSLSCNYELFECIELWREEKINKIVRDRTTNEETCGHIPLDVRRIINYRCIIPLLHHLYISSSPTLSIYQAISLLTSYT
jgi:hypothetical protein